MSEDLQGFWLGRHSGVIGETALDAGGDVLKPSSINVFQKKREFKGWVWAIAEIDPALLSDEIIRVIGNKHTWPVIFDLHRTFL